MPGSPSPSESPSNSPSLSPSTSPSASPSNSSSNSPSMSPSNSPSESPSPSPSAGPFDLDLAIMTKFNALVGSNRNAFYTDISGRLYNTQAPQTATFPYAVFTIISEINEYTFTTDFENVLLQFSLFSTEESVVEVENMYYHCKQLFDWCQLTVSDYTHLYMRRESSHRTKDDRPCWHRIVEYRVMAEKD